MAVSFDHPLGQTSDGIGGKCSSLLSCPEKWEIVSTCVYIHVYIYIYIPARIEKSSLRNEIEDFLRLVINETILDARTEDPSREFSIITFD